MSTWVHMIMWLWCTCHCGRARSYTWEKRGLTQALEIGSPGIDKQDIYQLCFVGQIFRPGLGRPYTSAMLSDCHFLLAIMEQGEDWRVGSHDPRCREELYRGWDGKVCPGGHPSSVRCSGLQRCPQPPGPTITTTMAVTHTQEMATCFYYHPTSPRLLLSCFV